MVLCFGIWHLVCRNDKSVYNSLQNKCLVGEIIANEEDKDLRREKQNVLELIFNFVQMILFALEVALCNKQFFIHKCFFSQQKMIGFI